MLLLEKSRKLLQINHGCVLSEGSSIKGDLAGMLCFSSSITTLLYNEELLIIIGPQIPVL